MKYILLILFAFFMVSCFVSCKKMIDKDIQIKASGTVSDELKNIRLANINITVYGLKTTLISGAIVDSIGTVKTNSNGEFEYVIHTDGKYNQYELEVNDYQKYISYEKYILRPSENNSVFIKLRERTNVFYKLKIIQTTAQSFVVSDGHRYHHLLGRAIDTTLVFKCLPNAINNISLRAKYLNINSERILSKVYTIGTKDTTVVETITNTDLLPTIR